MEHFLEAINQRIVDLKQIMKEKDFGMIHQNITLTTESGYAQKQKY